MQRLKTTEVAAVRAELLALQGGRCKLSGLPIKPGEAVLDHCHTTGQVRGVLHRGANSLLGKIENHRRIAGLTDDAKLGRVLHNVIRYLSQKDEYPPLLHPTHRTEEEKRMTRNRKAREARAKKAAT